MMRKIFTLILIFTIFGFARIDYSKRADVRAFVAKVSKKYGYSQSYLLNLFAKAKHQQKTLLRYQGKYKVGNTDYSWSRYKSKIILDPSSIALGKKFMRKNRRWLNLASKKYNVSPEIITAFIRVESKFGMYGNEYSVWDSLVTLAFNHNRMQKFFRSELEKLLLLAKKQHLDVLKLRGSFAGAMGCVQQVPSIQLRYGVDLDGDGKANPNSMADCIGSIANFLHKRGWRDSRPIIVKAKHRGNGFLKLKSGYRSKYSLATLKKYGITPDGRFYGDKAYFIRMRFNRGYDLYLGDKNYRIITRYNASKRYAVTIALYAKLMKR
jgi:membrane-bound lytic murein transglycosylase B